MFARVISYSAVRFDENPERGENLRVFVALYDTWMITTVIQCALSINWAFVAQTCA